MQPIKLIVTINKSQADIIIERLKLKLVNGKNNIYKGKNINDGDFDLVLVLLLDIKDLNNILEEYLPEKILNIGLANSKGHVDIKDGDVTLPNSFISTENKTPIFLEYAIGESYDLKKFGLILSGLCITGDLIEAADINDEDSFDVLTILNSNNLLEKTVVIKAINTNNDKCLISNSVDVLELVL